MSEAVARLRGGTLPTVEEIGRFLEAAHCRYPDRTALVEVGRSHRGRPVLALAIGRGASAEHARPSILLDGAHHGNEPLSAAFVLDAIAELLEPSDAASARLLDELVIVAVPLVNPDGYAVAGKGELGRKNGRDNDGDGKIGPSDGVDLNRNYPFRWGTQRHPWSSENPSFFRYHGPSAGSEPETQAMMRLATAEHFAASISYHTGTSRILVPYTIPNVKSPEPSVAWDIARLLQKAGRHPEGYVNAETRIYPVDGVDQDWLMHEHGTVAFLVEGSSVSHVPPKRLLPLLGAIRAGWIALARRYLDGPTLAGRVLDARGAPVEAEVIVDEIALREHERWTSRCRDGRFDRLLPAPGTYHLRVRAPGLSDVVREVEVRGRVTLDVSLPAVVREPAECPGWTHPAGRPATLDAAP